MTNSSLIDIRKPITENSPDVVDSKLFTWAAGDGYIDKNYWKDYLFGKETNPVPALSTEKLPEYVVDEYIPLASKKFIYDRSI